MQIGGACCEVCHVSSAAKRQSPGTWRTGQVWISAFCVSASLSYASLLPNSLAGLHFEAVAVRASSPEEGGEQSSSSGAGWDFCAEMVWRKEGERWDHSILWLTSLILLGKHFHKEPFILFLARWPKRLFDIGSFPIYCAYVLIFPIYSAPKRKGNYLCFRQRHKENQGLASAHLKNPRPRKELNPGVHSALCWEWMGSRRCQQGWSISTANVSGAGLLLPSSHLCHLGVSLSWVPCPGWVCTARAGALCVLGP